MKVQKSRQLQLAWCTFRGQREIDDGDFGRVLEKLIEKLKSRMNALIDQTELSDHREFSV